MKPRNFVQTSQVPNATEAGLALLELMVAVLLTFLTSLGVAMSLTTSLRVEKVTEVHLAAATLAAGKIELFAALDPATLDAGDNLTEAALTYPGLNITFTRTTTVVVNADNSRTLTVGVKSNSGMLPAHVNFSTTFALWQ